MAEEKNQVTNPLMVGKVTPPITSDKVVRPATKSGEVTRPGTSRPASTPSRPSSTTSGSSSTPSGPTSTRRRAAKSASSAPAAEYSSGRVVTSGRVDAPIGKGQYINPYEDNSTVTTHYGIAVTDPGSQPEQVAEVILGSAWKEVVSNPREVFCASSPDRDAMLGRAAKARALGATLTVAKSINIEYPFPGLKKGCAVTDPMEEHFTFEMSVQSWGSDQRRTKAVLLGEQAVQLQLELPLRFNYAEWEKDKMLELAQKLVDMEVVVEIKKSITVTLPLQ